eukprot:TRINITY_DN43732_c0_g1_i1.p1 TRINITY_DN43732_c0_g1~~TRINITY_DN43732_c0_g1_i1.p1  ORF type:complete len:711 (+),score=142.27 TRINITY_DN43732_c0_g1_i1:135-2267(+)
MDARARVADGRCTGSVTQWKGRFGWIWPDTPVKHDEAHKHGGRVYVHVKDVEDRVELAVGSAVSFVVYADGDGLGAEAVRIRDTSEIAAPTEAPCVGPGRGVPAVSRRSRSGYADGGRGGQPPKAFPPPPPPAGVVKHWWKTLKGDCCPISLTPLEELINEPFGLLGTTQGSDDPPATQVGFWGDRAEKVAASEQQHQAVHWFDGMFLASFLVSSGQLIDPTNRRPLSRAECASLDEYLAAHSLPSVHVADAYDLSQAAAKQDGGSGNRDRIAVLEREAASMLRSLFDCQSASRGSPPPPPPRSRQTPVGPPVGPPLGPASAEAAVAAVAAAAGDAPSTTGSSACTSSARGVSAGIGSALSGAGGSGGSDGGGRSALVARSALADDDGDWPGLARTSASAAGKLKKQMRSMQRPVHAEGSFTVLDDGEFDECTEDVCVATRAAGSSSADPTPAEALAAHDRARNGKAKAPARMPKVVRGGGARLVCKNDQLGRASFVVTGRTGVEGGGSGSSSSGSGRRWARASEQTSHEPVLTTSAAWVPEWASTTLHQRLLAELQTVQAAFSDRCRVLTPELCAHLEDCVRNGEVSCRVQPMRVEVSVGLGDGDASDVNSQHVSVNRDCSDRRYAVEFSLPLFYPVFGAAVIIRPRAAEDKTSTSTDSPLGRLRRALWTEVLQDREGSDVMVAALNWVETRGVLLFDVYCKEAASEGA